MPQLNVKGSAVEESDIYNVSSDWSEIEEAEYSLPAFANSGVVIIEMLRSMQKENRNHHRVAATKSDVAEESKLIIERLKENNRELAEAIEALKSHIDRFSVRRIFMVFSLVMIAICVAVLTSVLFRGALEIRSPLPEFGMLISIAMFFLTRALPLRRT